MQHKPLKAHVSQVLVGSLQKRSKLEGVQRCLFWDVWQEATPGTVSQSQSAQAPRTATSERMMYDLPHKYRLTR